MKERVTFVTAADEGFHQGVSSLLKSFALANRQLAPLEFIVMDCGLTASYRKELQADLSAFGESRHIALNLQYLKADLSRWEAFPAHWGSYAAYAFLEALQSVESRYLLFADADMLHFCEIASLLVELEASPYRLAAVIDNEITSLHKDYYVNALSPLKASEREAPYLNSGYLLFDLTRFEVRDLHRFVDGLSAQIAHQRVPGVKKFKHDQTLLNAFIKGQFLPIAERYNYYGKENQRFTNLPERVNVHFVSQPKPWLPGGYDQIAREYTFHVTQAALDGRPIPPLPSIRSAATLWSHAKCGLYQLTGKRKKALSARDSLISPAQLLQLQHTLLGWIRS